MSKFEFQFSLLRSVVAESHSLCSILNSAARAIQESATALDRTGQPFGHMPPKLLSAASSISKQSRLLDTWFSSLAEISRIWQQSETEILSGPVPGQHSAKAAAMPCSDNGKPGDHTASVEMEEGVKTTSPDVDTANPAASGADPSSSKPSASESAPEASDPSVSESDPGSSDSSASESAPEASDPSISDIDLGSQVASLTGEKPYSAPVFTTLDPLRKSAYIAVIATALHKQFPSLALSGSSRVEVPLGQGMTAYSSVSVSGNNSRSDHVKLSQAMDVNTGLLKENIRISADGSTVTFSKDGVSVSRKTDSGTWKIDPTSLSRTATVKLDDNTACSFTEKVDAKGYSSFDKTITSNVDGVSVSTSAGIKTSDTQKPGSPTPVLSPAVRHAEAQRQRMEALTKLLTAGLVGDLAGSAIPIPVPVPAG